MQELWHIAKPKSDKFEKINKSIINSKNKPTFRENSRETTNGKNNTRFLNKNVLTAEYKKYKRHVQKQL